MTDDVLHDADAADDVCGSCRHFAGFGDFDLCCDIQARRLTYDDTPACPLFVPKDGGIDEPNS